MSALNLDTNFYINIEEGLNVVYPENQNATYVSLVNYSDDLKKSFQRWYRYKEGFSIDLVKNLIREYAAYNDGVILDPFSGSGSTLIAAKEMGYEGVGFEVNPFSFFLSKVKLQDYTKQEIEQFKKFYEEVLRKENKEFPLPDLSFSEKVFTEDVRKKIMEIKQNIIDLECEINNNKVVELLKLGWIACIEELSEYRKAGNGLKKRKLKNPVILNEEDVFYKMDHQYAMMYNDLCQKTNNLEFNLINDSCLNLDEYVGPESVTGIIFSPPYANCFDYTEIYKLELWFGDFVNSYDDLKKLRNISLRSHLSSNLKEDVKSFYTLPELETIIAELEQKELWDKRIPSMLRFYFHDMFQLIEKCHNVLNKDGFCHIVVSNSAYGGLIVPTDILFAKFAQTLGFKVETIKVARYIITSSQQYEVTKKYKNLLRESVICLRK